MKAFSSQEIVKVANSLMIYNLGCEMIYLINHRLRSMIKEPRKIENTIKDIAASLFSSKIDNLIEHSESIIEIEGVQNILFKLCHCSTIMMDPVNFARLFQMISVAFKRQLILIKNNAGIYHVTMNHINGVNSILNSSSITKRTQKTLEYNLNRLSKIGFQIIKSRMMNLFIKKNHKIGLYLSDATQSNDGNILARPAAVSAWNVGVIGSVAVNGKATGVMGGLKPYSMVKKSKAVNLMAEEETLGSNVFDTIGEKSSHMDYVVLDKKYVKNISEQLSNVIVGGKREMTEGAITIDFDQFTQDESSFMNNTSAGIKSENNGNPVGGNDDGLMRFGAKKQETKKIDDVFGDLDGNTGGNAGSGSGKKEIQGGDLLSMMDDL